MGMMRSWAPLGVAIVAVWGASALADEVPRYRLEPGMELKYKGSSSFRHQNGSHDNESETTLWVVRKNGDGSVHVVISEGSRFSATSNRDSSKGEAKAKPKSPMDFSLGYFDIFPDGRIGPDAELGYRISVPALLPRLPDDAKQAEAGWKERDPAEGREYNYSAVKNDNAEWSFDAERVGFENKIYGMTSESKFHLNSARGTITRIETSYTQDYGFKGKGTGTVELTGVETRDTQWLTAFATAADRYFAANRAYEKATELASKSAADRAKDMLADAKKALKSAREAIDQPFFREQLDRQIAEHDSMAGYYADSAKRRAQVVDKASPGWELKGLDGKTHSLSDYRGKVVLLDFWYRGCGWCIKAMPQLNALADDFKDRPVVLLGMNTDRNLDDAKFVCDAMGLKYATLRAEGIPEKYGVRGFPTLIIIDPEGTVRDFHVGYSPTLRTDIAKAIEGLLPKK
jgi:thiol-disulfide isomerase/thioredoxin